MRILLDECIDRRFTREIVGYVVKTVPQMGWAGVKNGKLLALAVEEFDVFVTVDRNLSFQQNIPQFDIAVVVLQAPSNSLAALKPLASNLLAALGSAIKGQVTVVNRIMWLGDRVFWMDAWAIAFKEKTCKYPYGAKILQKLLHSPKLLSLPCNHLNECDKNYHIPASFLDY
nr:DUF5615 family PIN-like protein [Pseudanabaena sp. BC1403]